MGPIGVKKHIAPYLPSHPLLSTKIQTSTFSIVRIDGIQSGDFLAISIIHRLWGGFATLEKWTSGTYADHSTVCLRDPESKLWFSESGNEDKEEIHLQLMMYASLIRRLFDHFGCNAPDTVKMLGEQATHDETRIVGSFNYVYSEIFLHCDKSLVPKNQSAWIWGNPNSEITLPFWLSEDDVNYFASKFRRTGFTGGLNYCRPMDLNWESTASWTGEKIKAKVKFIVGDLDLTYNTPGVKDFIHKGGISKHVPFLQELV